MDDTTDPNADLIGYEFEVRGDPPTRWRVKGTDPVCGRGYVNLARIDVAPGGFGCYDSRIQNAAAVRRRRQLEQTTVAS